MSDEFFKRNRPPAPSRQPQHGEGLFEFLHGDDRYLCESRDYGTHGIEAQFWKNEEFLYSRRFDARLDRLRTPRALAIAWAEEERKAIEKGGT